MALINLNDLKPGMVLADAVLNKNGGLLLPKGAVLTDKHIRIFKTWGVTEADIEGAERGAGMEEALSFLSDEEVSEVEADLFMRFPEDSQNVVMAEIFRVAKKQRISQLVNRRTGPA